MRKLLLSACLLLLAASPAFAQVEWNFAETFPTGDDLPNLREGHGVATDADGKIWITNYYASDSVVVPQLVTADDDGKRPVRVIYVYNADGTQVDFSPIKFLTFPGGETDTLGGSLSRDTNGDLAWPSAGAGAFSNRGLRASSDGSAIYAAVSNKLYKIKASDGTGMAKTQFQDYCALTAPAVAAVDGSSDLVFVAPVCPADGVPMRILDGDDLSFLENALPRTYGFSRSFEVGDEGNTIYWAGYTLNGVFEYGREDDLSAFDSLGVVIPGVDSESMSYDPSGRLWVSGGSPNDLPNDLPGFTTNWAPQTWYAFNTDDFEVDTVPTAEASIQWNVAGGGGDEDGRPRGIAFSSDGMTAYVTQFAQDTPAFQRFNAPVAADYELSFSVDMSVADAEGSFDPATEMVWVAGGFFGDDWGATKMMLTDGDSDGVYTGSFEVNGLDSGDYFYKFIEGTESNLGWEGDVNGDDEGEDRKLTLTGGEADNDSDGLLDVDVPVAFFNNDSEITITYDYEILFQVDMGVQRARGAFDYEEDFVVVAGSFNGWNTTADTLFRDAFGANPDIFSNFVAVDAFDVSAPLKYKFVTDTDGSSETAPAGWESLPDRELSLTGDEPNDGSDGRKSAATPATTFFNNTTADQIFPAGGGSVTFEVDLRPAYYYLADEGRLPNDTQTGDPVTTLDGLFINGPVAGESNADEADDWAAWGPESLGALPGRALVDDGTNGDRVAGDSVFTIVLEYNEGALTQPNGKFGTDGYDNEAGFGGDHVFSLAPGATVTRIFGAIVGADGTISVTNGPSEAGNDYDEYIAVSDDGLTATVCRRNCGSVSVEQMSEEVPSSVSLMQNYPNPFSGETRFEFGLTRSEHVTLHVFDLTGRVVATLVDQMLPVGTHEATFDASGLAAGTYIYRLGTPTSMVTRKMTLVR